MAQTTSPSQTSVPLSSPLNTIEGQLIQLRDLTKNQSIVHDGQILQLSYWTKIAVEGIDTDPDFIFDMDNKSLEIKISHINLEEKTKLFKKKLSILCANVKWLLGDDFSIDIRVGRKIIHKD